MVGHGDVERIILVPADDVWEVAIALLKLADGLGVEWIFRQDFNPVVTAERIVGVLRRDFLCPSGQRLHLQSSATTCVGLLHHHEVGILVQDELHGWMQLCGVGPTMVVEGGYIIGHDLEHPGRVSYGSCSTNGEIGPQAGPCRQQAGKQGHSQDPSAPD